jgi:hypothetical protein
MFLLGMRVLRILLPSVPTGGAEGEMQRIGHEVGHWWQVVIGKDLCLGYDHFE